MRERIKLDMFVDPNEPNVLMFRPQSGDKFTDNTIYKINLSEIDFEDGSSIESQVIEYVTKPDPMFIRIEDVTSLVDGIPLDEKRVLYHIREACRELNYRIFNFNVEKRNGRMSMGYLDAEDVKETEYYPIYMYLRYMSAYNAILEYYINLAAHPQQVKDQVADLIREEKLSLKYLKDLLDMLLAKAQDWINRVIQIYAAPKSAVRARTVAFDYKVWKPEYALARYEPRDNFSRRF